jgi:type II secretory ATPase GspE/PulE/Tfp pilus assembly ATPase PilB-like protein
MNFNDSTYTASENPFWIGEELLKCGSITSEQLTSAKQVWRKTPSLKFSSILETLGLIHSRELIELLALHYHVSVASLDPKHLDRETIRLIPQNAARSRNAIPFKRIENTLHLAVEDPSQYGLTQAQADFPNSTIQIEIASRKDIQGALDEAWKERLPHGVSDLFSDLLRDAVNERATDIHIEPRESRIDIRLRIDGILIHRRCFEKEFREPLIQAAKIAGKIDITEKRLPQDGQGNICIGTRDYHLRFSCIPTIYGESIVVRIIDDRAGLRTFTEAGIWPKDQAHIQNLLSHPNGLIYVTGPTGSGKTTLLYSMLHNLAPEKINGLKMITLEEPVEVRHRRFFMQIDVDEKIGRSFSELLRHVLRHDPDVILVGETRDKATAEITLRAALTGRLCLSTLHTNDALGAITRLTDIGLDPLMISTALRGVIAQRLVRKPCPQCSSLHPNSDLLIKRHEALISKHSMPDTPVAFKQINLNTTCSHCSGRGYLGRTSIMEVYSFVGLERIIAKNTSLDFLRSELKSLGFCTLLEDGILKAAYGLTTIEEVIAAVELF